MWQAGQSGTHFAACQPASPAGFTLGKQGGLEPLFACWGNLSPSPFERFLQNRLRSCGAEHHSILKSESRIFRLTAFRHIRFFLISVNRHLAKVSAHILYPKLCHPRLYQAEFSFIYEEFDLYRSLTDCGFSLFYHYDEHS